MKDQKDYYSYSRLRTFDHCNRFYHYHYNLGLPTLLSFAAEYSSKMIHEPLAARYNGLEWDLNAQWQALEALGLSNPNANIFTPEKASRLIARYWRELGQYDASQCKILAAEKFFYIEDLEFQAKLDLLILTKDKELYIYDHKISTYEAKPLLMPFNNQLLSYANVILRQPDFEGKAIWLGINFFGLYHETIVRDLIPLDMQQLEDYNRSYQVKLQQIKACHSADQWPKSSPDSCIRYYGKEKKRCEFWEKCTIS